MTAWPTHPDGTRLAGLAYGGDYNPEQWPRETWAEDVRPDARGRRDAGDRRGVLLGAARAGGGPVRPRLARRRPRPAARRRHRRRPGHRHRLPAPVAVAPLPRDAPPAGRRDRAVAGRAAGVVPQLAGLPGAGPRAGHGPGGAVPRPPGAGDVARLQRARRPQQPLLLRRVGGGLPRLAARALRRPRRPERGVGHRVLEPAVRRVGARAAAAHRTHVPQPDPAAGLRPVQLGRAARLLRRRARPAAPAQPGHPGHHQLHGHAARARHGLPALGSRAGRRLAGPLPGGARPGRATSSCPGRPTSPAAPPTDGRGSSWSTPRAP